MKIYEASRNADLAEVTVNGRALNPRLDLWLHSPTGFNWSYDSNGSAQLALALLADHLENDNEAVALHQEFKCFVERLPRDGWTLTSLQIQQVVEALKSATTPLRFRFWKII